MSDVILWLITVELIGLAAFPLAYFLLPNLADRGYGLSKPLGILAIGYMAWLLSVLHVVPSTRPGLFGFLVATAAVSGWLVYRHRSNMTGFVKQNWRLIALSELVFLTFFLGWTLFRMYDPAIDHTEQPMDFAFLNASVRSTHGQPEDPWLRGETVSYYYFGYWMMGVLSEMSGVATRVSYNLSMALIPALASAAVLSIVLSMVRAERGDTRYGLVSGVAAGVVLGVVANLAGVLEFMRANAVGSQAFYDWISIDKLSGPAEAPTDDWTPDEFWWWFRATRVINTFEDGVGIDYTIQEFPFFSFMLGDLHPHVAAVPFTLLFAGFVFNFVRAGTLDFRSLRPWGWASVIAMGVVLGGLAFTNMWDLPTGVALLIGAVALRTYGNLHSGIGSQRCPDTRPSEQSEHEDDPCQPSSEKPGRAEQGPEPLRDTLRSTAIAVAQVPALVISLVFILFLPYYLGFASSVSGIGAVATPTRYIHTFIVWGVPLVIVAPFVVACFWQTTVGPDWRRLSAVSLLVAFLPFFAWMLFRLESSTSIGSPVTRLFHILPLGLLIAMSAWSALYYMRERGSTGRAFALALATLALSLIMGPELLYVDDYFGEPSHRMNTVFKLYYQAWVLLAVVSGFAIYYWLASRHALTGLRRALSTVWAVGAVTLLLCGLYYTAAAPVSKADDFNSVATLDGLAFVRERSPAEYGAIRFIQENLPINSAILESVGEWSDAGLISRSTGVPTVLNWPTHQLQWRGSLAKFDGRSMDVTRIYETPDTAVAQNLLAQYDVEYVYIGPRERAKHEGPGLSKFADFMDTVFEQEDVAIHRVRK